MAGLSCPQVSVGRAEGKASCLQLELRVLSNPWERAEQCGLDRNMTARCLQDVIWVTFSQWVCWYGGKKEKEKGGLVIL